MIINKFFPSNVKSFSTVPLAKFTAMSPVFSTISGIWPFLFLNLRDGLKESGWRIEVELVGEMQVKSINLKIPSEQSTISWSSPISEPKFERIVMLVVSLVLKTLLHFYTKAKLSITLTIIIQMFTIDGRVLSS